MPFSNAYIWSVVRPALVLVYMTILLVGVGTALSTFRYTPAGTSFLVK